ncbi:hypothetical protein [Sphingorhabdus sp. 109]|jgi:hypothetical protein|uniref:hypothetical protein n=1 Tax=Sphingorhabdus sp. 109 TaxID=2653173 RepID=UPI0012EFD596|nr:hypothetical protein [Sphingorhabdus sp. 109]VWX57815.1 conserved hypothetical protein [Sphingorhabdus sp. 109]
MFDFFESDYRRAKDAREIKSYFARYGEQAIDILAERASDRDLCSRDRRHWRRLARKARRRQGKSGTRLSAG